jgi:hypothetical protein
MQEIAKYEPLGMVTFKDGSSPVFVPAAQIDAIGEAVNSGKNPLVHIGNRWVERYAVREIVPLSEYDQATAKGWLPLCPPEYRGRMALHIAKNEEAAGHPLEARWAQSTLAAWQSEK